MSDLRILGPKETGFIKSKLTKYSNSIFEKPPSGPINIDKGLEVLFKISIIGFPPFSLQNIIGSLLFLSSVYSFWKREELLFQTEQLGNQYEYIGAFMCFFLAALIYFFDSASSVT